LEQSWEPAGEVVVVAALIEAQESIRSDGLAHVWEEAATVVEVEEVASG
jgi:hypothetical protein